MGELAGVNHERAVRAFERKGFWVKRQAGHTSMTDGVRTITIPRNNPINAYTMKGIVKDAGMTVEEFRRLL